MESKAVLPWRQVSHRSWERDDGAVIVKQYCPREGGTYFVRLVNFRRDRFKTLAEAMA